VPAVDDLEIIDYLTYRRDAFIHSLNQTQAGQEYLSGAQVLEVTKPDRKALREFCSRARG